MSSKHQGCQMVCFQTKNPDLGKFWRVLQWKILVYFMTIWSILLFLWLFGILSPVLVFCTKKNLASIAISQRCFSTGNSFQLCFAKLLALHK
jgi:hypothetical protein